ncbi:prsA6 (nucleomorph) [Hemiselmis andersenii]|uniref:Proteasome subunit alpha type n=1 Tax=Hemiselmis andersenii TaxID=464988 RepID=A9BK84_HEMAN|nr:prsA6 [Hemiselmis andersenii]ABW97917.1 prsA6 [Hemiselmis andersenii]|mmetsp:Transcript_26253/g.60858  ORF Transcript_26253/g.60858 Transcript_26253/m.60858 type:complete len:289 (-) Transcript_26253:637-1503(-)
MFRTEYDSDITIFSPNGDIHQINYAKNASNKGNILIGLKTSSHCLMVSLNQKSESLDNKYNKILSISKNLGAIVSGIIGDGKYIHKYLEKKKIEYSQFNNRSPLLSWIVSNAKKIFCQNIFHSRTRPYGVSVVIGGYDSNGPQLFLISPDGIVQKFRKLITGSNEQFEIQFLERNLHLFNQRNQKFSIDELLFSFYLSLGHGLKNRVKFALVGRKTPWFIANKKFTEFFLKNFKKKNLKKRYIFLKNPYLKTLKLNNFFKEKPLKIFFFSFLNIYKKTKKILKKTKKI